MNHNTEPKTETFRQRLKRAALAFLNRVAPEMPRYGEFTYGDDTEFVLPNLPGIKRDVE